MVDSVTFLCFPNANLNVRHSLASGVSSSENTMSRSDICSSIVQFFFCLFLWNQKKKKTTEVRMISRFSRFFHCCLLLFGVVFSPHSAGMGSLFSFIFCKVFFTFFFNFFIFFHFFLFSSFVVVFRMGLVFISQTQSTTSRA